MGPAVSRAIRAGLSVITTQVSPKPADFADVRTTNLAVVLRYIRANAPCSRADIAAATGLNKATVSSLAAELIERRLIRETGLAEQRIGRPATLLVLDGSPYAAVGVAVDADHLTLIASDLAGERLLSWRRAYHGRDTGPGKAVAAIAALARRAVARLDVEDRQILGLTLAVPGLVRPDGTVQSASGLGWQDLDVAELLCRAMRRPTFPISVENDANVAALAEHRYGLPAAANLIHLTGTSRISAGIIADGRLLRGGLGFAGELSHLTVDSRGPRCECGRRGCLESIAGIPALVRRLSPDEFPELAWSPDDALDLQPEVEDIAVRARSGQDQVLSELEIAGRALGYGVSVLANLINPEAVFLGGHFATLAPWLVPAAAAELADRAVPGCRLLASTLGHDAAAVGAAARVLDSVDAGQVQALRAG